MIDRLIQKEVIVSASLDEVWEAWTTLAGVKTFFASKANVELAIGGPYEMFFNLDAPPGSQGGEGLKVLSYLPKEMLSFEWNAPPDFPTLREKELTWVVVQFEPLQSNRVRVKLTHLGWKDGDEWERLYQYFLRAWEIVLGRLVYRFSSGPLDWTNPYTP